MNVNIRTQSKKIWMLILLPAILLLCAACGMAENDRLTVTCLKVGKADAIILENDGHTMVIDTGEEEDGREVVSFLEKRSIDRLDALIITHFDGDHVGGADTLIKGVAIDKVYLPDYEGDGKQYRGFVKAMETYKLQPERLDEDVTFALGSCEVRIDPPKAYEIPEDAYEYDNDFSLITTVTHGEDRFVFMGDAESKRISEWLSAVADPSCTVLKMPHHGRYDDELPALLQATSPKKAIMCTSKKNPADDDTLNLLSEYGIEAYQTKDGDITIVSDGAGVTIRQLGLFHE